MQLYSYIVSTHQTVPAHVTLATQFGNNMNILLQSIENVPDGAMGIAKAHRPKNRYLNIHTCESCNAVL